MRSRIMSFMCARCVYLRAPRRWRTIGRVRGAGLGGIGRRETVDCAARNVAGVEERRSRGEVQRRRALDVVDAARGESRVTVRACGG